jgi:hypothetical protein
VKSTCAIIAATLLIGAAGTAMANESTPEFRKRPLYVVLPESTSFSAWSAGKLFGDVPLAIACPLCGVLTQATTTGLARKDGKKVALAHEIQDPALAIGQPLAKAFCPMIACSEVHVVSQPVPRYQNSARELRDLVPADAYAMVLRTNNWGFIAIGTKWKRYRVFYIASVAVFDMSSGNRLSHRSLDYREKFEDNNEAPTRDQLLADDGALLKEKLRSVEAHAVDEFSRTLTDRWVTGARHMQEFARRYTAAWCGQNPAAVAAFFAENGSLTINGGKPAVGRAAIEEVARSFMQAFPDMVVQFDRLSRWRDGHVYHWTLTGANTGPGGTGAAVRISGEERWLIDADNRIMASQGSFDEAEYQRQLRIGTTGQD